MNSESKNNQVLPNFTVNRNNTEYNFIIANANKSKNGVIIFFPSATSPEVINNKIITFHRHSWAESLNCYCCIFVSDPFSLSYPIILNTYGSWFFDKYGRNVLSDIVDILLTNTNLLNNSKFIVTYGSSMGGVRSTYCRCSFERKFSNL